MPKVLFCTESAHVWGGVAKWLDQLTAGLSDRGWDVVVGLVRGWNFHDPDRYHAAHPQMQTVVIRADAPTPRARVKAIIQTLRWVKPDVVVPVTIYDPIRAVAECKSQGCPVRMVTTYRGFVPAALASQRPYLEFIDLGVAVNRLLAEVLVHYCGLERERVFCIPATRDWCSDGIVPQRADRSSSFLHIGYVGRFEQEEKRVLDAVGLVRRLEERRLDYRFTMVGAGPCEEILRTQLKGEIKAGRVNILGYQSLHDIGEKLLPQLDCLVLFSQAEGSPNAVWEAMSVGVVPVIARYLGCRTDAAIRHGVNGLLFEPGEVEEAADHLVRLHRNREWLEQLSRSIAGGPNRGLSCKQMADEWSQVLEQALARPIACGRKVPPFLIPKPRLEQLGVPTQLAHFVRRSLGRVPVFRSPGDEWPHAGPCAQEEVQQAIAIARTLDRFESLNKYN